MPRVLLTEDERFPTLYVDDCSWRGEPMGSEPPGFYPDEVVHDVPQELIAALEAAQRALREAEDAITAHVASPVSRAALRER
jgi:hypothetical protein